MKAQGRIFRQLRQANALRKVLFFPDGAINTATVGKSPFILAAMAGFEIPTGSRILVARFRKWARTNRFHGKN